MRKKIWKYVIPEDKFFSISMPVHSRVVCFQMQRDVPVIWVEMTEEEAITLAHFCCVATGEEFPDDYNKYIGTVQDGGLVMHLFQSVEALTAWV